MPARRPTASRRPPPLALPALPTDDAGWLPGERPAAAARARSAGPSTRRGSGTPPEGFMAGLVGGFASVVAAALAVLLLHHLG